MRKDFQDKRAKKKEKRQIKKLLRDHDPHSSFKKKKGVKNGNQSEREMDTSGKVVD